MIDVSHPLAKKLKPLCKKYKDAVSERMGWGREEIELKGKILAALAEDESIKPGPDGKKKVEFDGFKITVTPRDELVQVSIDDEDEAAEAA